jgi:hypothetical protein
MRTPDRRAARRNRPGTPGSARPGSVLAHDTPRGQAIRRVCIRAGNDLRMALSREGAACIGPARLVRASGDEPFGTVRDGPPATGHPEPGEVGWRDDAGVTCRCWNWRQCVRTRITCSTSRAAFILDGLAALGGDGLAVAGQELAGHVTALHPGARFSARQAGAGVVPHAAASRWVQRCTAGFIEAARPCRHAPGASVSCCRPGAGGGGGRRRQCRSGHGADSARRRDRRRGSALSGAASAPRHIRRSRGHHLTSKNIK